MEVFDQNPVMTQGKVRLDNLRFPGESSVLCENLPAFVFSAAFWVTNILFFFFLRGKGWTYEYLRFVLGLSPWGCALKLAMKVLLQRPPTSGPMKMFLSFVATLPFICWYFFHCFWVWEPQIRNLSFYPNMVLFTPERSLRTNGTNFTHVRPPPFTAQR